MQTSESSKITCLHIGELRIARLPKDKFAFDSWTIGEKFKPFVSETLLMVMENLISASELFYMRPGKSQHSAFYFPGRVFPILFG
jgi:hypothetical protein